MTVLTCGKAGICLRSINVQEDPLVRHWDQHHPTGIPPYHRLRTLLLWRLDQLSKDRPGKEDRVSATPIESWDHNGLPGLPERLEQRPHRVPRDGEPSIRAVNCGCEVDI